MDPTTVLRWGPCEAPEFDQRCRPYLRATHEASRVDETYSKLNKPWYDRYRAVDATGATLDCRLSATREADAAACCFRKVLQASHTRTPRVSTGDKNAAYPPAFAALQPDSPRPETCRLRPCKYLKNIVEPDHRWVQHRVHPGEGWGRAPQRRGPSRAMTPCTCSAKASSRGASRAMSSPSTGSSTSGSGGPHQERSPSLSAWSHQFLQHYHVE